MAGGDKDRKTDSSGTKGSGSRIVLYGSEHLSVEDEGVNAEEEGDDDDSGARPQINLKRGRTISSKPDPNPKQLKKKNLDFKTITLDDDEVDQVTGFSTAGGLLENLDAHLHGGRTPRDQPVNLPTTPIYFGGPTTKVIEDIHMHEPLSFKKIEPSPSSKPTTGVASNVSRPSLNRSMVGSLVNKDRIVDALSAKMALFHLGNHAEHAYHRKMSSLELGNALMLNQAQSNSLVVETYERWVEAESNCPGFEREVASLKSEDSIRSKTKQEISSLRSQVNRFKEQMSEAKEVNKSSQASAAAAHEARDKAISELENVKLKFEKLEKKLSEVEKRNVAEQKEMRSSYDQL
ncbi:hypothetical protein Hanom_Chr16g01500561 [Helianthus anomalus]